MEPTAFKDHEVHGILAQFEETLTNEENRRKIDLEKITFFQEAGQYISHRISLAIPILVQANEMNALAGDMNAVLTEINHFLANNNQGHLQNATNQLHTSINRTRNLPQIAAGNAADFSRSIANFQSTLSAKYADIKEIATKQENELAKIQNEITEKAKELTQLSKLVEQKELDIKNLNSTFQTEFNNIKSKTQQDFESDRKAYRAEIDADKANYSSQIEELRTEIEGEANGIIQALQDNLEKAKQIVNIVGNVGLTGNYQRIANKHNFAANLWRFVAIFFMTGFSGILIYTIYDLSTQEFNWIKSLFRLLAAGALSYPATYAARESSKHRELETTNRTAELELASIAPFLQDMADDKKQAIKEKLADRYFGNNRNEAAMKQKNNDTFSLANLEKLLDIASKHFKK